MNVISLRTALFSSVFAAVTSMPSPAQSRTVVPGFAANTEQQTLSRVPGLGFDGRLQFVIAASELTPALNHDLHGIEFRRDTSSGGDLLAGSANVTVRVGVASSEPGALTPGFAANAPNTIEVYRGVLQAPSSTATSYAGWVAPHVLRIDFAQNYTYSGGPLAIEIHGDSPTHLWWPVDAVSEPSNGVATRLGSSCSPLAAQSFGSTLSAHAPSLRVGSTAIFTQETVAGAVGCLAFGLSSLPTPLDLTTIGAPGCWLHTLPLTVLPPAMSRVDPWLGGIHEFHIQLPADPAFLSASFVVQGLELGMPGLWTSEALICSVASSAPSLGMAAVWAIGNGVPHVSHDLVPVIGILHD